eukprot:909866-Pelagomonas_calceolata.AAC.1
MHLPIKWRVGCRVTPPPSWPHCAPYQHGMGTDDTDRHVRGSDTRVMQLCPLLMDVVLISATFNGQKSLLA